MHYCPFVFKKRGAVWTGLNCHYGGNIGQVALWMLDAGAA